MSGQTFSAGQRATGTQLTNIVYQNEEGVSAQAASDSSTSSSYANMTGTSSFTFTKALAATRVKIEMSVGWSSSAGGTCLARFGVLVNGSDNDCCGNIIGLSQFMTSSGFVIISGLAAGAWTIQGRMKRTGGAGTLQRGTNEWLAISAAEIT